MNTEIKPFPLITQAVRDGNSAEVFALFGQHPEMLRIQVPGFGTWLHFAAALGTVEIVKQLAASGFDINAREREGRTPIVEAASKQNVDVVRYLLEQGAILDTTTSVRNPLFAAIVGGSPEVVNLLLSAGIDTSSRYYLGKNPTEEVDAVAFAMLQGAHDVARLIALRNSDGDQVAAKAAMSEGLRVAQAITQAES